MDVIQDLILYREGKKWKERYAVLRPISPNSDINALVFYKDASQAKRRGGHKRMIHLLGFCGITSLQKTDRVEHGLAVITANETVYLAFNTNEIKDKWKTHLQNHYGSERRYVVRIPEKQKVKAGEASLRIYSRFFGLTSTKTFRCVGRWTFQELSRYASIEGGFMFETLGSNQMRGHIYKLATQDGDSIMRTFDFVTNNEGQNLALPGHSKDIDLHGSGMFDDLQRSGRDPTFFQRCMLRVSARMKKPKRGRHRESVVKNRADPVEAVEDTTIDRKTEKYTPNVADINLFANPPNQESTSDWVNAKRSASFANFSQQRNSADFTSAYKNVAAPPVGKSNSKRISETNRSRASRTSGSYGTYATDISSEVLDESRGIRPDDIKQDSSTGNGPPSAPPRSPISLVEFDFDQAVPKREEDNVIIKVNNDRKDYSSTSSVNNNETDSKKIDAQGSDGSQTSINDKRAKEYEELWKRFQCNYSANDGSDSNIKDTVDKSEKIDLNNADSNQVPAIMDAVNVDTSSNIKPPVQKYVNVRIPALPSTGSVDDGSYMNISGSATVGRGKDKPKKPQPLRLTSASLWDKYDDDDGAIYHHVDPLVSGNGHISRSVENFGNYRNINGAGSYENLTISGVPTTDKSYMNLGSTSPSKRLTGSLNYILVDGVTNDTNPSPKSLSAQGPNRSGHKSFDAWPAYDGANKTDYTMIDDKATQLLNRTRQQHWQQREDDANLKRHGKNK